MVELQQKGANLDETCLAYVSVSVPKTRFLNIVVTFTA